MIRRIEELSMNAFPSEKILQYDGWILRGTPGNLTKRINSVNPLYPSTYPLNEKIQTAESFFAAYGAPSVFKMTSAALPENLDDELLTRGYEEKSRTLILTRNLNRHPSESEHFSFEGNPYYEDVAVEFSLSEAWLSKFCSVSGKDNNARDSLSDVLTKIVPSAIYISIDDIAFGMGVIDSGYIGIYNISVDKSQRRKGLGLKIMKALLALGLEHGADKTYLQVEASNTPAVNMYMKLGYEKSHEYWYRVKDIQGTQV